MARSGRALGWVALCLCVAAGVAASSKPPTFVVSIEEGQLDQVRLVVGMAVRVFLFLSHASTKWSTNNQYNVVVNTIKLL